MDSYRIALAGSPNAGKTSLFNALTGARQHVGNYPGVTVERRQGHFSFENRRYDVLDLPGTYSLTSFSPEERIAQESLLISAPCTATIALTRRETGHWKWALLHLGGLTAVAYLVSLAVFQVSRLFA